MGNPFRKQSVLCRTVSKYDDKESGKCHGCYEDIL